MDRIRVRVRPDKYTRYPQGINHMAFVCLTSEVSLESRDGRIKARRIQKEREVAVAENIIHNRRQ